MLLAGLAACGERSAPDAPPGPPLPTAATLGTQDIRTVAEYLSEPVYATANTELGDRLLMQCRACHSLGRDEPHRLGPNLYGLFGRRAGSAPGFGFTAALIESDFIWTPRALDAWLAQPSRFLPGNAMAYGGIRHADDRAALLASLMRHTAELEPANDGANAPGQETGK